MFIFSVLPPHTYMFTHANLGLAVWCCRCGMSNCFRLSLVCTVSICSFFYWQEEIFTRKNRKQRDTTRQGAYVVLNISVYTVDSFSLLHVIKANHVCKVAPNQYWILGEADTDIDIWHLNIMVIGCYCWNINLCVLSLGGAV